MFTYSWINLYHKDMKRNKTSVNGKLNTFSNTEPLVDLFPWTSSANNIRDEYNSRLGIFDQIVDV